MVKIKPQIVSLFCGAGGLDLGFRNQGFSVALACDNSAPAVDSYNLNTRPRVGRVADLSKISSDELIDLIEDATPGARPVGVIGGPPCQGFSQGNAFADPEDPRNYLPFKYANLLAGLNQKYSLQFFVFENVMGLLNKSHVERFSEIQEEFEAAGFRIFQQELNAVSFGVAQRRRRLFIVGLNKAIFPKTDFEFPSRKRKIKSVRDAIGGLPPPTFVRHGLQASEIAYHANHWTSQPRSEKLITGGSARGRSFRRLSWDTESPTVAYGNREIHVHPDGGRRLSIHEAMLLQGFPKKYRLTGNFSQQVTQVSNAVPPPVALALAKSIQKTIDFAR